MLSRMMLLFMRRRKLSYSYLWAASLFTAMLWSSAAAGQVRGCDFRDKIVAHLELKYQEHIVGRGINNAGAMVELFSSADGLTWSIVITRPDGWACLVGAGEAWREVEPIDGIAA